MLFAETGDFVFLTLHVLYSSLEDTSLLIHDLNLLSDHTVSSVAVEFSSGQILCVLGAVTNRRNPFLPVGSIYFQVKEIPGSHQRICHLS